MKKRLLVIIAAIIAVAGVATFFIIKNGGAIGDCEPQRAKIDKAFVCYFDIEQLAKKGVLDKHITLDQRRLAASMASANIHDSEVSAHTEALITDLSMSGVDITKPVYGYFDVDTEAMVFVAEVADVDNLDKTIGIMSYMAEQEDGAHLEIKQVEDDRYVYLNDALLCYNTSRAAVVIADDEVLNVVASDVLSSLLLDISIFDGTDMAVYVDINTVINLVDSNLVDDIYRDTISELRMNLTEDAYFVSSLTFDPGRAILHSYFEGVNMEAYNTSCEKVTFNHLNYIDDNLLAAMSGSVNGVKCAEFIQDALSEHAAKFDNETNMAIAIVLDAIETIDGDVTLALQSIDGEYKEYIDYYWGDVAYRPIISDASGALMADVTDTYIISNVGEFASGFLKKAGDSIYTGQFGSYKVNLEQRDNLLFAGVNTPMELVEKPASKARWIKDIDGSIAYMVIDVDNVMESSFVESVSKVLVENMEYPQIYTQLTQKLSYAYLTLCKDGSSDLVFVMDDASTNSLEQLNDVLLPVVVSEFIKSIM